MKIFHAAPFAFGILFLLFLPSHHTWSEKNYCLQSKPLIDTRVEHSDTCKLVELSEEDNDDVIQRAVKSSLDESVSHEFNYRAVYYTALGDASQKISAASLPRYLVLGIIRI